MTRDDAMLPNAVQQNPACGSCGGETDFDGDRFNCPECGLIYCLDDLSASFANPDTPACGAKCDNYWHGDHKIKAGHGFDCGTCRLPSGHAATSHWTGCRPKQLPLRAVLDLPSFFGSVG